MPLATLSQGAGIAALGLLALIGLLLPAPAGARVNAGIMLLALSLASLARIEPGHSLAISISVGVLLAGLALIGWQVAGGPGHGEPRWKGRAVIVVGVAVIPLLVAALAPGSVDLRAGPVALTLVVTVAVTAVAGVAGRSLGIRRLGARLDQMIFGLERRLAAPADRADAILRLTHSALALGTLVLAGVHLTFGAAVGALLAGAVVVRRGGGRTLSSIMGIGVALFAWYVIVRVGAGTSPVVAELRQGPYSEAFERLVVVPLAALAWLSVGLWPAHRGTVGPAGSLIGAALTVRVMAGGFPHGLEHWQPLLFLVLALGAAVAALLGDPRLGLVTLAATGLLSGLPPATWASLGWLGLLAVRDLTETSGFRPAGTRRIGGVVLTVTGAVLLVPVLTGALASEVFWTVLVVCGAAIAVGAPPESRLQQR